MLTKRREKGEKTRHWTYRDKGGQGGIADVRAIKIKSFGL